MKTLKWVAVGMIVWVSIKGCAQVYVKADYMSCSPYRDNRNEKTGSSGDFASVQAGALLPLSLKKQDDGRMELWALALNGTYAALHNHSFAEKMCPDDMLNAQIGLMYLHPFGKNWSILALASGGLFTETSAISWKHLMGMGGVVIIYHIKPNLSVGLGAGITNDFGIPMIMPTGYVEWKIDGKYQINVSCVTSCEATASMQITPKLKLTLVAIQMEGMSAIMETEDKTMIYGHSSVISAIQPEYDLAPHLMLKFTAGASWYRSASLFNRNWKGFTQYWKEDNIPSFEVAAYLSAGITYGF